MPSLIAYGALLMWPLVALGLFLAMPYRRAIVWTILAGYLLLPTSTSFDPPGVPSLNKDSLPALAAFVLAFCFAPKGHFRWPKSVVVNVLMALCVLAPVLTAVTNKDFLVVGSTMRPGMTWYDAVASSAGTVFMLMPFLLGAGFLRDETRHRDILKIFVTAASFYSILILWEIRFSPNLEMSIYGVGGDFFVQQMRGNGFRSKAFLGHGLLVSTFCAMAIVAAIGLVREKQKLFGVSAAFFVIYLSAILVINKSAGALLIALMICPLFYWFKPKRFVAMALIAAAMIVSYPALRGVGLVPVQQIVSIANSYSPDRAESLGFRVVNEDMLLNRAAERPWFGWGGYGRNRVFVVADWGQTLDITVTDGTWIILIGTLGWIGYFAEFGLLCYPFWHAFKVRHKGLSVASTALAAVHLINLIDLIPNSSLRPITWLIAGALSGAVATRRSAAVPGFAARRAASQPVAHST